MHEKFHGVDGESAKIPGALEEPSSVKDEGRTPEASRAGRTPGVCTPARQEVKNLREKLLLTHGLRAVSHRPFLSAPRSGQPRETPDWIGGKWGAALMNVHSSRDV